MLGIFAVLLLVISPVVAVVFICLFISKSKENKRQREELNKFYFGNPNPEKINEKTCYPVPPLPPQYSQPVQQIRQQSNQTTTPSQQPVQQQNTPVSQPYQQYIPQDNAQYSYIMKNENVNKSDCNYLNNNPIPENKNLQNMTYNKPKKEKSDVSTINIMLVIGALLVVISGIVFATTSWQSFPSFVQATVLFSFAAIFFVLSALAEKKLHLEKTGILFYILGSVFIPISFIAGGFMNLFGEWFALGGNGQSLLLAVTCVALSVAMFIGFRKYKYQAFLWICFYGLSATLCFLTYQISDSFTIITFIQGIYTLLLIIFNKKINGFLSERLSVTISHFEILVFINTLVFTISSMVDSALTDIAVANGISLALFGSAYLISSIKSNEKSKYPEQSAIAFAVLIIFSMYSFFRPDSLANAPFFIIMSATILFILSQLKIIPECFAKVFKVLNIGIALFSFVFMLISLIDYDSISLAQVIIYGFFAVEIAVIAHLKRNDNTLNYFKYIFPISAVVFVAVLTEFFKLELSESIMFFTAMIFVIELILVYFKKLTVRTQLSDCLFSSLVLGSQLVLLFCDATLVNFVSLALCLACVCVSMIGQSINYKKLFLAFCCIVFAFSSVYFNGLFSQFIIFNNPLHDYILCLSVAIPAIMLMAMSFIFFSNKKFSSVERTLSITVKFIIPVYILVLMFCNCLAYIIIALFSALLIVRSLKVKSKLEYIFGLLVFIFALGDLARNVFDEFTRERIGLVLFGAVGILYVANELLKSKKFVYYDISEKTLRYSLFCLNFYLIMVFNDYETYTLPILLLGLASLAITTFIFIYKKNQLPLLIPFLCTYPAICNQVNGLTNAQNFKSDSYVTFIVVNCFLIITIVLSYIFYRNSLFEKKQGEKIPFALDIFALSRIIGFCIIYYLNVNIYTNWFKLIAFAICVISFKRKNQKEFTKNILLTITASVIALAVQQQPFVDIPQLYKLEYTMLPVVALFVILGYWWKKQQNVIEILAFIMTVICYIVLFIDAIRTQQLFDGLFIVITSVIVIIISFVVKIKKWFILSIVTTLVATVFMTRMFWQSLGWWAYLLGAGLILIGIGVFNEMKKQAKIKGEDSKLTRFMSEWKW